VAGDLDRILVPLLMNIRKVGWRLRAATRSESGMVTAEMALAIPALVAVVVALAWLLSLGVTQGLVAQAAREGARAAARGESSGSVRAVARQVAPEAAVTVRRSGRSVWVTASVTRTPPVRFLRPLRREVRASATSWREDS
jgi:Flp pilus assembly protein TadG